MPREQKAVETEAEEREEDAKVFIEKLDSGEFDGHLFEEIRKLRAEHLAKVCRMLVKRKYEER